jgi:hypothetical protein
MLLFSNTTFQVLKIHSTRIRKALLRDDQEFYFYFLPFPKAASSVVVLGFKLDYNRGRCSIFFARTSSSAARRIYNNLQNDLQQRSVSYNASSLPAITKQNQKKKKETGSLTENTPDP